MLGQHIACRKVHCDRNFGQDLREVDEELGIGLTPEGVRLLAQEVWKSPNTGDDKTVHFFEALAPLQWGQFAVREGAGAAFLMKTEIAAMRDVSLLAKTFIARYC